MQRCHLPRMIIRLCICYADWIVKKIGGRVEGDAFEAWDMAINRSVVAKCYKEVCGIVCSCVCLH